MLPLKDGLPGEALRLVPYLTPGEITRLRRGCRPAPGAGHGNHRTKAP
jgi:hypothetical protein